MSDYLDVLTAQIGVVWTYAAPVLAAIGEAALAAAQRPSMAWVAAVAVLCLWLPRKPWEAPGKTWGGAFVAAFVAFVIAAALGAALAAGRG